jgi:hypothetical protein
VPLRSCPEASWSLPRKTMKSFSSLQRQSTVSLRPGHAEARSDAYRISKRVKACFPVTFPVTEVKGLKDGIAGFTSERPRTAEAPLRTSSTNLVVSVGILLCCSSARTGQRASYRMFSVGTAQKAGEEVAVGRRFGDLGFNGFVGRVRRRGA